MSQQNFNDNIVNWTFENYATLASLVSGIAICLLVFYIYSRSGSLIFLRDLMWRFFGGSTKFETEDYENIRKNLREVEYYRFEFNIPAQNLADTKLAEEWIKKNGFCHRDVARVRKYIDWKDFNSLTFKEALFSKYAQYMFFGLLFIFFLIISISAPLTNAKYLMVSLRDAPEAPSFYLSEGDAKFSFFRSTPTLTEKECQSPESLKEIFNKEFTEKNINIICSLFDDKKYREHVNNGLKGQRGLLLTIIATSIFSVFCILVRISRSSIAKKLHEKIHPPKRKIFKK
ncbi:DUF6216 family protein [Pseudomonas brenneri]|uniref:Uncharacterized protein n=1 Tax=Pseudomonas brenneri TaxID=129817 RepID=A0A5B2UQ58_9PSED|nr:DUF6216 family protein [Pseudomonas brenneri]KAA2227985.1 hypothetical protein F1720_20550 [Pseudomonas brenneri]TWR78759.1 hypothetical protein FJD34_13010 [Pseudomonas brenneri]SDU83845.1 hypothetical protein SAMN04490181_0300 [Pseudomonas brenneri]